MKIKQIKQLRYKGRGKLPKFWRSPLAIPETEENAVSWAEGQGASVLYWYERHGKRLYLVEVKAE